MSGVAQDADGERLRITALLAERRREIERALRVDVRWWLPIGLAAVCTTLQVSRSPDGTVIQFGLSSLTGVMLALIWLPSLLRLIPTIPLIVRFGGVEVESSGSAGFLEQQAAWLLRKNAERLDAEDRVTALDVIARSERQAASAVGDPIVTLQDLATEYDAIRAREPSSRSRTERLERLLTVARGAARLMARDDAMALARGWLDLATTDRHGRHAVALGIGQAWADPALYEQVMALLGDPEHRTLRFEQLHALQYLGGVLPVLNDERLAALRSELPRLKAQLEIRDTTDRGVLIKLLLRRLSAKSDEAAP